MTIADDMRTIVRAALFGDPALDSLGVVGNDAASLVWSITPGVPPNRIGGSDYTGGVPFSRELLVELVGRTMRHRAAGGAPTDEDLDRLREIHPACQSVCECNAGWSDLLHSTFAWIEETGDLVWRTEQIKEKWAGLRLYFSGDPGVLGRQIIDAAEHVSMHICETCGAPGRVRHRGGWWLTSCDQHAPID
ncbi:MAG: hypothetical protein GX970_05445 [Phyllobacteriaceae bacterium]|nr:hypothetical protein [Phyllobacteriaceae bacterium]